MDDAMVRARARRIDEDRGLFRPSRVAERNDEPTRFRVAPLSRRHEAPRSRRPRVPTPPARDRSLEDATPRRVGGARAGGLDELAACAACRTREHHRDDQVRPRVVPAVPDDADPSEADALARCACAYARRACDLPDATCEIRRRVRALAVGRPRVPCPAVRRAVRRSRAPGAPERLCRLCRREMDRGLVAARVDPLWTTWTYGWYSAWLVFLAVDAVVAASLAGGGLGQPYWGYVPYDNTSHHAVPK